MQKSRSRGLGVLITLLALFALVWWQQQAVYDWFRLRGYTPPAAVAALATNTTMNDDTRRVFYVNHPQVESQAQFNSDCRDSEQTIVLGCFIAGRGIFLYKIDDPRLDGVEEVTAAHETLHAEYERLSSKEKATVDAMTAAAYAQLDDPRIKTNIDLYRAKDPSVVPNELHSILGTEVRNLPADLEAYYQKYFTNRGAIVTYSEQYEQAFTDRQNQVASYDAQLKGLKQQIDSAQETLQNQVTDLKNQKARMDALSAAQRYDEYNASVAPYNAKVNQYNALVTKTQSQIDQYNKLVEQRNAIAQEEGQLVKAIDSRPSTVQTQ